MNLNKGIPTEDGWYLVAINDPIKGHRLIRCFWRNNPKKVYYKKDGKLKYRYKGSKGWSEQNLKGRTVLGWIKKPEVDIE